MCYSGETYSAIHLNRRWWILQTVKPIKGCTVTTSCPLDSKSHHVNISCKKGLTTKQVEYVSVIGIEQVYECEIIIYNK